jgi:hypothetical protein
VSDRVPGPNMSDSEIFIPRRKPGPRPVECETFKTSVRILGERQVETFRAMCALAGRRPHELAADIVLEAIREAQHDHQTQQLVQAVKRYRSGLRLVGPHSREGRNEMLHAMGDDGD